MVTQTASKSARPATKAKSTPAKPAAKTTGKPGVEERLSDLENMVRLMDKKLTAALAAPAPASASSEAMAVDLLKKKLSDLTIKRHAVLTATLGGVSYAEIAKIMGCDVTTVKLHLRAALQLLDIPSREALLVSHRRMLDPIDDRDYEITFSVGKRWWLEQKPDLMNVLRTVKPSRNQHNTG
jgi:DNA-binding CsgD family transcriptional regulator